MEEEAFGQLSTHELKEGGTDIPVTDDNKNVRERGREGGSERGREGGREGGKG